MIAKGIFFVFLVVAIAFLLSNDCLIIDQIFGAARKSPESFFSKASPEAQALLERAWHDLPGGYAYDFHVHVIGDEKDGGRKS